MKGGYYSTNTFTFSGGTTLTYTGELKSTAERLPDGYGGITGNTASYYTVKRNEQQLAAPAISGIGETSITIDVVAGQTYYLRETATGEAAQTYTATANGTHTFEGLALATTYYIYTSLEGQSEQADPYYTPSANTTARTRTPAGTELISDGSFEDQNASGVWQGLNVNSATATPEIGTTSPYGLGSVGAADGSYICELNGSSNSYPEAVYQKIHVYPGTTITVSVHVIKRLDSSSTGQTMRMGVVTEASWANFTSGALTPTVTSGSATVSGTTITPGNSWSTVTCDYTVPEGVYEVYVYFQAITPSSGISNLIDKISVVEQEKVETDNIYVSATGDDATGNGTEAKPFKTLAKAYSAVEDGGTIHVMTADVATGSLGTPNQTARFSNYSSSAYLTSNKNVTISGAGYDSASIKHNNGNAPMIVSSGSDTTTFEDIILTSYGSGLAGYGNADNALVDVRGGAVTMTNVTVTGHYNTGTRTGNYGSADWTAGTIRVTGGTLNLNGCSITGNTTNGSVYVTGGTVSLSGATSISGNTLKGSGGANLLLYGTATVNVADDFSGSVGVTQTGAVAQGVFGVTGSAETASAKADFFTDDTGKFSAAASGANLIWSAVTYMPDQTRIVVMSDDPNETFTINGVQGTKVFDEESGKYITTFEGLTPSTTYAVASSNGGSKNVTTLAISALQKAIESASPFTIYEGDTVTLASMLGSKVSHLSGCVSLSNMTVGSADIATVYGTGRYASITGVKLGQTSLSMTAATRGCGVYGTTTANHVTIDIIVVPKLQIKNTIVDKNSIKVTDCDSRFQYALYKEDGEIEWVTPTPDGDGGYYVDFTGLSEGTTYTIMVRYGDGNNEYGTAERDITTGQTYKGGVEKVYAYSTGTSVTAGFKVTLDNAPSGSYTVRLTDESGNTAGTAALQGGYFGGNYVVKVSGLTAGATYNVQALVNGQPVGEAISWTAPAATYASHNGTSNTGTYWSNNQVSTSTDSSGMTNVNSGIAYSVKDNSRVDIQGYGRVKTTYSNAGWTIRTSNSNLMVWAEPTIISGASGAEYVALTYYVRNNSASNLSNVWLGANADIMIGSNDRAPVYKTDYGIRTAVSSAEDALAFAIITQHGGGVAQYADTVSTVWFGRYSLRSANTFSSTSASSLSGVDSGAAFSWKIPSLAAGEIGSYTVVIGVAGTDSVAGDTGGNDPFVTDPGAENETTTETGTKLPAPTVTDTTTDSVTIQVKAGQTYILRLTADGEAYMTFDATTSGTYTFEGLAPSTGYYVYTKMTQETEGVLESDNTAATTKAVTPNYQGDIILHDASINDGTLTYTFPTAEVTPDKLYTLSVMVDSGTFRMGSLPAGYASVAGVDASGNYVSVANTTGSYTYLIFNFGDTGISKADAETFLRSITYTTAGNDQPQTVDVDGDVMPLESGIVRLGSSYYKYVPYRAIPWSTAYAAAKASSFNGLPGYLMSIENAMEHNFVYRAFGSVNGWMGGLRVSSSATGFDGSTYHAVNPGTQNSIWKWVCGPSAGTTFWNGYHSGAGNAVSGVYANWSSGEPNNSTNEYAVQYGYGAGGRWNDYTPTNRNIGGYFIEYTAYGSYQAANPMAHDDETVTITIAGNIADVSHSSSPNDSSHSALQDAIDQAVKVNAQTNTDTAVVKLTGNVTSTETVTVPAGETVYLNLNGKQAAPTINVEAGATLYVFDSSTDGYTGGENAPRIKITGGGTVAPITEVSKEQDGARAKTYLTVKHDDGTYSFHRFNVQVASYKGKIDNAAGTAELDFTLGYQGDSAVTAALQKLGAGVSVKGDTVNIKYGWKDNAITGAQNPLKYTARLINLDTTDMVNGYIDPFDLRGALDFGTTKKDGATVTRSFLQILKLYYNKSATEAERTEIETFVQNKGLETQWEALG